MDKPGLKMVCFFPYTIQNPPHNMPYMLCELALHVKGAVYKAVELRLLDGKRDVTLLDCCMVPPARARKSIVLQVQSTI